MSSIHSVSSYTSAASTTAASASTDTAKAADTASASEKTGFSKEAAVYEKSSDDKATSKTTKGDRSAIIQQLKADAEQRAQQLMDIVNRSLSQQGKVWNKSQGLAEAFKNLQATDDEIAQAKKDVSEDGYWGVKQTSDRIVDFAKTLAGGDASKAAELLDAFKKGYEKATQAWGTDLPSISQDTYKAVEEKFNKWMNGDE